MVTFDEEDITKDKCLETYGIEWDGTRKAHLSFQGDRCELFWFLSFERVSGSHME